ncbi:uncharacterized protein PB18E9.04c-like [Leptopilina heterotoma]|uniref:uncharacterized protein PB18E9.04c-like n=1 Tax=Leptopilina heterotoma TaxID=63436 RepID=UPI001CA9606A|nr:uncharacterized protein PB18E9.04c-like [Leptopilina heterotoma]
MDKIELLGGACFSHGPYTFYKAVRIENGRVLRLGSFFLTKLWSDADLVSIGELQLLWLDSRGPNTPLASLRLYFLPENTPDGRRDTHGEDEVLTISEKVVVRVHDLVTWLAPSLEWSWGREVSYPPTPLSSPENTPTNHDVGQPQVLTDPGIDFTDVDKQQQEYESNHNPIKQFDASLQTKVIVLSYPRYCRYRSLLRRLEGSEPSWLWTSIAAAVGGFTATPGTRILFCRDTFDYPDLETHELLCNHLAPKLKGRPRRKRKKRSVSPGESSNESEASVASSVVASTSKVSSSNSLISRSSSSGVRRSERKMSVEEKKFLSDVDKFMNSRGTPVGKMPLLGYRQIDLFLFYTKVQTLGGYDSVSAGRLWKSIYDDIGGNTASTSAATITRRHYERLLLPYERYQRGEESKIRPAHGRRTKTSSSSEEAIEVKDEPEDSYSREPSPPSGTPNSTTVTPSLQSILSTSALLPGEKPRMESGKTSSLRSVRVKPDRLKSLNTIIANAPSASQLPSPPPSSTTSSSTPNSTPSTTPTGGSQSVLERQLNSPLMSQQVPPPSSPPGLPVSAVTSNASTVVTLTPPPEKDIKEIKLDPKQTTLLAQGKENIPLFDEKPIFLEKPIVVPPRSPEVIDLENESDSSRDKIIIPSFKRQKLEILREGGLEVTAVDSRPSVIQPNSTTPSPTNVKSEEKPLVSLSQITAPSIPKLISVTVTPDIGHILPSSQENHNHHNHHHHQQQQQQQQHHVKHQTPTKQSTNHNSNSTSPVSRVINLGNSNAALMQLYANANVAVSNTTSTTTTTTTQSSNHRFVPPVIANGRAVPPRVTQSRSIFAHNEKMVYGNPKDILTTQKYLPPVVAVQTTPPPPSPSPRNECLPTGVLDLTQKQQPTFFRPSLEIVRVPVVPRPNPIDFDTRNSHNKSSSSPRKEQFPNYPTLLDTRTMASNNLEITLVNPKKQHSNSPLPSPTSRNCIPIQRRQLNGKYPVRTEPVSPYTPRKPIIPNVPNLSQLNSSTSRSNSTTTQLSSIDKRKTPDLHRRISEGDKNQQIDKHGNDSSTTRRHSVPNPPTGFVPNMTQNASSFLAQLPNNPGKFLPMIDPIYYPALYNGFFPPPMSTATTAPFLSPEFNAYYKELLASSSQSRLGIAGQTPTVPTSK